MMEDDFKPAPKGEEWEMVGQPTIYTNGAWDRLKMERIWYRAGFRWGWASGFLCGLSVGAFVLGAML